MKRILLLGLSLCCSSCATYKAGSSYYYQGRIEFNPPPMFRGLHVVDLTVNGKQASPHDTIAITHAEGTNVVLKFRIGSGYADPIFIRTTRSYTAEVYTPSGRGGTMFRGGQISWGRGQWKYTMLQPGFLVRGKRSWCYCHTLAEGCVVDLSDEDEDWATAEVEYLFGALYYVAGDKTKPYEAILRFPLKFVLKNTEPSTEGDGLKPAP